MKKLLIILSAIFLITVPAFAKKDASWVLKKATVESDPFENVSLITFPTINYRQMGGEVKEYTGIGIMKSPYFLYFFKAKVGGDTPTEYILEVKNPRVNLAGHKSFANYQKALDKNGKLLDFKLIEQYEPKSGNITRTTPEEIFNITFDDGYIKSHKDSGIVIKVYGDTENHIFHISPWYIEGMLSKINTIN